MIRIATAECFTHGRVAREIHAFSRGYLSEYAWRLAPETVSLSLVAGLFIPTVEGVRTILRFDPLPPIETIQGIKVYDEEGDREMAVKMAMAVREITSSDIGIGTTAGIGRGGIAIVNGDMTLLSTSGVYADLWTSDPVSIMERQEGGIQTALMLLEDLLCERDVTSPTGGITGVIRHRQYGGY